MLTFSTKIWNMSVPVTQWPNDFSKQLIFLHLALGGEQKRTWLT
jgi:hypothetical protein